MAESKDQAKRGDFCDEYVNILFSLTECDKDVATLEYVYKEQVYKNLLSKVESIKFRLDNLLKTMKDE